MPSRRQSVVLLSAVALGTPLAASLAASAAPSSPTVGSVITATKAALAKQSGVHLALASKTGSTKDYVSADFSTKSGIEIVNLGTATATIKVTPSYSYIGGNSLGLTSIMGLSAAQAKKVGSRWISLKSGTSQYTTIASGTTMSSVANVLPAATRAAMSTTTIHGSKYYVLKWTVPASSTALKTTNTLSIAATGAMLPYEETAVSSTGAGTTSFSKWGEHVNVTAPPSSSLITYAAVVA